MGKRQGRYEHKFIISERDYLHLKRLLPLVMKTDPFTSVRGKYIVRSIYFDDPFDSAFFEKIDGVFERKKFRIRYYDYSDKVIKLEKKEKVGSVTYKTDMLLDRKTLDQVLQDPVRLDSNAFSNPLYKEFVMYCKAKRLMPKVIVEYAREAYLLNYESIRICFDSQIRAAVPQADCFTPALQTHAVSDSNLHILEVKYIRFLPNYIREIIESIETTQTAFSKYGLSRLTLDNRFKFYKG